MNHVLRCSRITVIIILHQKFIDEYADCVHYICGSGIISDSHDSFLNEMIYKKSWQDTEEQSL